MRNQELEKVLEVNTRRETNECELPVPSINHRIRGNRLRQISEDRSSECGHPVPSNHPVVTAVHNLGFLTRLRLVSDKFLCMLRKSVAFLVDRYDRGVTMSRDYGGFYLNTNYFRPFLLFSMSFQSPARRCPGSPLNGF